MSTDFHNYPTHPDLHGDEDLIDECPICGRDYFNCKCTIEELSELDNYHLEQELEDVETKMS